MSIQAVAWVLDESEAEGSDRLILIAIANHFDKQEPWRCWPGVGLIAREARLSERTVQRSIASLVAAGRLLVVVGAGGGPHTRADRRPSVYLIVGYLDRATEWAEAISRGVRLSPRLRVGGMPDGVTKTLNRGDKAGTPSTPDGVTLLSPDPIDPSDPTTPPLPPQGGRRTRDSLIDETMDDPDFVAFYDTYPRHVGKREAAKAWRKALKRAGEPGVILDQAAALARLVGPDQDHIAHPATWLNGYRWEQDQAQYAGPSRPPERETETQVGARFRDKALVPDCAACEDSYWVDGPGGQVIPCQRCAPTQAAAPTL